ncbi:MAG TPA: pentapeptide repeat-containing protein, partial [Candidatus Dojkabacteria bacterium]|nr:pentapeptide repeat-containing protein [Candidatus Dojkabacteria bacterium]
KKCDFTGSTLKEASFRRSDLFEAVFQNTILEKADFRKAKNYCFEISNNRCKNAMFSYPEVLALLKPFKIVIEE